MEAREQRVVLILADISGYTKFMVENQLSAVHGQLVITGLIEALLTEVNIPLRLQEIEGDAVFAYTESSGSDEQWREVLAQIRVKLLRFFDAFYAGMVAAMESTPCKCAICRNVEEMKLKIIVHSGRAVFNTIAGRQQISGTDVILAHRLLKNSIPSSEYLLMSEAAYKDLGREMPGRFVEHEESYAELGKVKVFVRYLDEVRETHRDALYGLSRARLALRGEAYVIGTGLIRQSAAAVEQLRHPIVPVGPLKRAGFALWLLLLIPFHAIVAMVAVPLKLLSRQTARRRARGVV